MLIISSLFQTSTKTTILKCTTLTKLKGYCSLHSSFAHTWWI